MKKILIVDDELLVRMGIRMMMDWETHGYTIVGEAADGAEALAKIEQLRPDLVLTDLKMNGMDGLELISTCHARHREIHFVVLSNYNDFENVRAAMKCGADDYIFKLTAKESEMLRVLQEIPWQEDIAASEQVLRKNLPALKNNLFYKGVQQTYLSQQDYLAEYQAFSLRVPLLEPYIILSVSINDYAARKNRGDLNQLQITIYSMCNIAEEVLNHTCPAEVFSSEKGELSILCNCPVDAGEDSFVKMLSSAFGVVYEYFERYLNLSVSGALSRLHAGVEGLGAAMLENTCTLGSRHLFAPGYAGRYADRGGAQPGEPAFTAATLEEILRCRSCTEAATFFTDCFTWFSTDQRCTINEMRRRLYELAAVLARYAEKEKRTFSRDMLYHTIERCDTLEPMRQAFLQVIRELFPQENIQRPEIRAVQQEILHDLAREYTVAQAAAGAHMSESYFAHLFKRETGLSFLDWLNRMRIERAQELLQDTDARVGEIAQQVGFENRNYFSVLYKKLCGCTPLETREGKKQDSNPS